MKIAMFLIAVCAVVTGAGAGGYPTIPDQDKNQSPWLICRSEENYRVFKVQQDVVDALETVASLKQDRIQQKRISAEAGVRNLTREYEIGAQIVAANDDVKIFWAQYKDRGGKASGPQKIPRNLVDPCENVK